MKSDNLHQFARRLPTIRVFETVRLVACLLVTAGSPSLTAQCISFVNVLEGRAGAITSNENIVAFTGAKMGATPDVPPTGIVGYAYRNRVDQRLLPMPSQPQGIALAPDDSIWITDFQFGALHHIAVDGTLSSFSVGQGSLPYRLVVGPDNAIWFTTHSGFLGRMTASGTLTKYPIWPLAFDLGFDAAGILWIAEDRGLLRFDPLSAMQQSFLVQQGTRIYSLAFAPDGRVWFTDRNSPRVGRFDPATSTFRFFQLPAAISHVLLGAIARGSDNRMWFTGYGGPDRSSAIGAIDQTGLTSFWLLPHDTFVDSITAGPKNVLWFTAGTMIGRFEATCRRRAVRH